jgi:hypothetical protein
MNFPDLTSIGSVTLILFSVIDILGAIPVILDIKKRSGGIEPLKATLVAGGIMFGFLYLGEKVLKLFGVDNFYRRRFLATKKFGVRHALRLECTRRHYYTLETILLEKVNVR